MFRSSHTEGPALTTAQSPAVLVGLTAPKAATPTKTSLPGESPWASVGDLHSHDTVAQVADPATGTTVRMYRGNGDDLFFQVTQGNIPYHSQSANGASVDAPYLVVANGFVWAFHRGHDNQVYYAFMSMATPTTGSNFRLSAWQPVLGAHTSNTPVATERSGDLWVAYRSENSGVLRTIHASANGILNGHPDWVDNVATPASSNFGPALTNYGGTLTLAYINGVSLVTRSRNPEGGWSNPSVMSAGLPALWGRPSIMASGDSLDIAVLGNDPDSRGGRTIYRVAFHSVNGHFQTDEGWTTDPRGFRSPSPVMLWAAVTAATWVIGMSIRGLQADLQWVKTLSSRKR